jgi:hypothetical protein
VRGWQRLILQANIEDTSIYGYTSLIITSVRVMERERERERERKRWTDRRRMQMDA